MSELTAQDGISNYFITFEGLDQIPNSGDTVVRFKIVQIERDQNIFETTLSFHVEAMNDGMSGMMVRAHDKLVNALRQMLWCAAQMRDHYKSEAARVGPKQK